MSSYVGARYNWALFFVSPFPRERSTNETKIAPDQPMSARVVAQLFQKHASTIVSRQRFDRARLSEIVDGWRCSTLFDFSEVTEDVAFAEFPRVVFFGSTRFLIDVLFVELVGFPNTDFLNDVRFDVAFPGILWACFDSARVGFPEVGRLTTFDFPGGYHR